MIGAVVCYQLLKPNEMPTQVYEGYNCVYELPYPFNVVEWLRKHFPPPNDDDEV